MDGPNGLGTSVMTDQSSPKERSSDQRLMLDTVSFDASPAGARRRWRPTISRVPADHPLTNSVAPSPPSPSPLSPEDHVLASSPALPASPSLRVPSAGPRLKRLASLASVAIGLGSLVPLVLVLYLSRQTGDPAPTPPIHAESMNAETRVAVGESAPATMEKSPESLSIQPPASSVIEYAPTEPPTISPRRFILARGSPRAYAPEMSLSHDDPQSHLRKPKINIRELKRTEQSRYSSAQQPIEWQGGWTFNDPARNIELGTSYSKYLEQQVGSSQPRGLSGLPTSSRS